MKRKIKTRMNDQDIFNSFCAEQPQIIESWYTIDIQESYPYFLEKAKDET